MVKKRQWLVVLIGLLGMGALFAACAAPTEKVASPRGVGTQALPTATPLGAEVKPVTGGVLRGYYTTDPYIWDPLASTLAEHTGWNRVVSPLIHMDFGCGKDPRNFDFSKDSLATSWEISKDGLTYTFRLRQGVKWDERPPLNGREFVAEDVKWTYETHMATPGAPRREQLSAAIQSIECPDKYTVVIRLKEPMPDFVLLLSGPYIEILPREVRELYGDFSSPKAMMGFGAFSLDEYVPGVKMVYKKNPNYYKAPRPYVDGMYFVLIPDASTSLAAFRAEKIDIRTVSRLDLASLKQSNPMVYCEEAELSMTGYGLAFRTDKAPFNDVNLRRAVSMAINRQEVIDTVYFGYAVEQTGPMYVGAPWHLQDLGECAKYEKYNAEEARRLLAAAGYPAGLSVSFNVTSAYGEDYLNYCQYLVDAMSKVGIKATMKMYESGAFTSTVRTKKVYDDMTFLALWSVASFGPDVWLNQLYGTGYASNISLVSDPKLDPMLKAQAEEMDPVKRQELINEIQRYLECQAYYVNWPIALTVTCIQPWVRAYCPHIAAAGLGGRIAENMWLVEDAPGRKGVLPGS